MLEKIAFCVDINNIGQNIYDGEAFTKFWWF